MGLLAVAERARVLPPWADARWRQAASTPYGQALIQELAALEAADLSTPLPQLTAELYSQVHRTGERLPFERVRQERRRRLARAAVRPLVSCWRSPAGPGRPMCVIPVPAERVGAVVTHGSWRRSQPCRLRSSGNSLCEKPSATQALALQEQAERYVIVHEEVVQSERVLRLVASCRCSADNCEFFGGCSAAGLARRSAVAAALLIHPGPNAHNLQA